MCIETTAWDDLAAGVTNNSLMHNQPGMGLFESTMINKDIIAQQKTNKGYRESKIPW